MISFELLAERVIKKIDEIKSNIIELSHYIHSNPEIAWEEVKSSKRILEILKSFSFEIDHVPPSTPTAVVARKTKTPSLSVAFIAEYDALPKIGHGCGHNIIAASSVGAAVGISDIIDQINGSIYIIGTPAEEGGGGKIHLLKEGIFDGIDVAMMIHPSNRTQIVKRTLAVKEVTFKFYGRSSHASATPFLGINALDAVIQTFNAVNALRQQLRPDARVHGIILDGGVRPNIIPDFASCQFLVRAIDLDYLYEILEKVKNCAHGAALSTGARLEVDISERVYEPFLPNYELSGLFRKHLKSLGVVPDEEDEMKNLGSSDIGNISRRLPTLHAYIAICDRNIPLHSSTFADMSKSPRADEVCLIAAKALALTALEIIISPDILKRIKEEFRRSSSRGQSYQG